MKYLFPGSILIVFAILCAWMIDNAAYYRGRNERTEQLLQIDNELIQIEGYLFGDGGRSEPWATSLDGMRGRLRAARLRITDMDRPSEYQFPAPPVGAGVHPSAPRSDGKYAEFMARYNSRTKQSQKWNGNEWVPYSDDEVPPPAPPFDEHGPDGWMNFLVVQPVGEAKPDDMRWVELKPGQ